MSVCKEHVKDVNKHFESVESSVEYAETIQILLDILLPQQEAANALDTETKVQGMIIIRINVIDYCLTNRVEQVGGL